MRLRMQPKFVTVDKLVGILQNASGNPNWETLKFKQLVPTFV